ncbi:MAG: tRNA epoxyqueuosine(34) reductase QueG [Clostridioides sp.]|jgi:epoxyqueuosine reductase|nr:tRNA epoxyqueuosine(34) reductase QueG [Clostridioides sp.]
MKLENQILRDICNQLGIEMVGVCGVEKSEKLKNILKTRALNGYTTGLEEQDLEKRVNPRLIMEDAQSIIVCAFPYYVGDFEGSNLAKYCYGEDYHLVIKKMLADVCDSLSSEISGFKFEIFTDNGPLVDRYLAYMAGIGYYGINNNIITDEYGSYILIGYIVNNFDFEKDKPLDKTCIKCQKCVKHCPGNSILGNYEINPRTCLSYLTQKKGELSSEEENSLKKGKKVFGCDICQEVCPHNKEIPKTKIESFANDLITSLDKDIVDNMSNRKFKRDYGDRAFSWRGKGVIFRNIELMRRK